MGTLNEDLTAIKCVEDTLDSNKVARFSYTEEAYRCNCADGVTVYDVDNEQNIPVGNAEIMKVNETVLSKGWRSQASSLTRMMMNHFIGRLSYNVNKLTDNVSGLLDTVLSHLGNANGIATLDSTGRIPASQLPVTATEYKGSWNANTNTPQLADGMAGATNGDFYIVSVGGTQDLGSGSIQFFANDRVIYNGSVWERLSAGDVKTVNNIQPVDGNITLTKGDIGLGNVDNTADANKNVASAVNATCFDGHTYECAKADIRGGLGTVTVSDVIGTAKTKIALCTGATTVGRATGYDLAYGAGQLFGVSEIVCQGANDSTYCNVILRAGNCANKYSGAGANQYARAVFCGANGIFYSPVGVYTGTVYTGNVCNVGSGATNCDINIAYGSTNFTSGVKLCGSAGVVYVYSGSYVGEIRAKIQAENCATAGLRVLGVGEVYANTCLESNVHQYEKRLAVPMADRAKPNDITNLRCYLFGNYSQCSFNCKDFYGTFVAMPPLGCYRPYVRCDCSDVTCCIGCNMSEYAEPISFFVGDAYYFEDRCCFGVYCSTTPAGHSWMGTTLYNDTCVDLCVDLHGGHCDCYEGCSISLKKGCSYTFCSCIYTWWDGSTTRNSDAWAYVRLAPECSGKLSCAYFTSVQVLDSAKYLPPIRP